MTALDLTSDADTSMTGFSLTPVETSEPEELELYTGVIVTSTGRHGNILGSRWNKARTGIELLVGVTYHEPGNICTKMEYYTRAELGICVHNATGGTGRWQHHNAD